MELEQLPEGRLRPLPQDVRLRPLRASRRSGRARHPRPLPALRPAAHVRERLRDLAALAVSFVLVVGPLLCSVGGWRW